MNYQLSTDRPVFRQTLSAHTHESCGKTSPRVVAPTPTHLQCMSRTKRPEDPSKRKILNDLRETCHEVQTPDGWTRRSPRRILVTLRSQRLNPMAIRVYIFHRADMPNLTAQLMVDGLHSLHRRPTRIRSRHTQPKTPCHRVTNPSARAIPPSSHPRTDQSQATNTINPPSPRPVRVCPT